MMSEVTKEMEQEVKASVKALEVNKGTQTRKRFAPRVDIYEVNDNVVLVADMPGVDETSIEITLEKDLLTIRGTVLLIEHEGYNLSYAEYRTGDYARTFTLSNDVDRSKIEATIRNGVLRLTLPKAESAKPKRIEVQT
jgi:HSP20 family molecular chaperone IbpA